MNARIAAVLLLSVFLQRAQTTPVPEVEKLKENLAHYLPGGKVLKLNGAFKAVEAAQDKRPEITQSCDFVECYLSGSERGEYFVTLHDLTSTWIGGSAKTLTFTKSVYFDGDSVLDLVQFGKTAAAEISTPKAKSFSPYEVGIGYTARYLFFDPQSPLNKALGAPGKAQVTISRDGDSLLVSVAKATIAGNGSVDQNITITLGESDFRLESYEEQTTVKVGSLTSIQGEKIAVTSWRSIGSFMFPSNAIHLKTANGQESFREEFSLRSTEIIDAFPKSLPVPPRTDLTDKRSGISIRTGDAPTIVIPKIQEYLKGLPSPSKK